MNAIVGHPVGYSSVNFSSFLTKCGLFVLGAIVGIASVVGVLRIGEAEAERTGSYTATPAVSMRDAGNVTTPDPSHSSAPISAGMSDTNSFFSDYRLERDACCPGE